MLPIRHIPSCELEAFRKVHEGDIHVVMLCEHGPSYLQQLLKHRQHLCEFIQFETDDVLFNFVAFLNEGHKNDDKMMYYQNWKPLDKLLYSTKLPLFK